VSFRISEEEYQSLLESCLAQGARSMSEFARVATCRLFTTLPVHRRQVVETQIEELSQKVQNLQQELRRCLGRPEKF